MRGDEAACWLVGGCGGRNGSGGVAAGGAVMRTVLWGFDVRGLSCLEKALKFIEGDFSWEVITVHDVGQPVSVVLLYYIMYCYEYQCCLSAHPAVPESVQFCTSMIATHLECVYAYIGVPQVKREDKVKPNFVTCSLSAQKSALRDWVGNVADYQKAAAHLQTRLQCYPEVVEKGPVGLLNLRQE